MPNFGVWEWIVLLTIFMVIFGWYLVFSGKVIPKLIKEIRLIWHNADPNDNHRDL